MSVISLVPNIFMAPFCDFSSVALELKIQTLPLYGLCYCHAKNRKDVRKSFLKKK